MLCSGLTNLTLKGKSNYIVCRLGSSSLTLDEESVPVELEFKVLRDKDK